MDQLGPIPISNPPTIGDFPLKGDFGSGLDHAPVIAVHQFDQPGLKVEQRFILAGGARRFRIQRARLACSEYDLLREHWEQAYGVYAQFKFTYRLADGSDEVYTCRYENPMLSFSQMMGMLMGTPGITLLEIPAPPDPYVSMKRVTITTLDATIQAALQADVQRVVPLIAIQDRAGATTPLYISNQRINIDTKQFLPRLVSWQGIQQSIGEASDAAKFSFGNADGVFTLLANQINLNRAQVQFSLFHVDSGYIIDVWAGYALPYAINPDGTFDLGATDGTFQMGLGYPTRYVTRTCWKVYKGRFCPSTSSFPTCPKDQASCVARGVPLSFGGMMVPALAVNVKDNSTGVFGFGRSTLTSVTVTDDTVYQRSVPEVWTDEAMPINCDVIAGRDEDTFFAALGLVSDGPIGAYSTNLYLQTLDGQPPEDPIRGGGWRGMLGNDPAFPNDFFSLTQAPWNTIPPGSTYAAGLAFAEIRRTDAAGLQLAPLTDRKMQVTVSQGVGGWTWTAPGARHWTPGLTNAVWVAVNVFLRGMGLRLDQAREDVMPASVMEQFFDVGAAIEAAFWCDDMVDKLVGTGQEKQFPFRGILKERKPLKNWLTEILNCCLGYYTFVNGKLWIGLRNNSSVLAGNAFARETILHKTLQTPPIQPSFNWLNIQFGDEEFLFALNNVTIYDLDHAAFTGTPESPNYMQATMSLVGCSNKSQASRIAITRLREELGGIKVVDPDSGAVLDDQQLRARGLNFKTTILALGTKIGDIISMTDPSLAGGYAEGRVTQWTLNPDLSISIQASPTTDHMYDYDVGPKPQDVSADPPRPEKFPTISGLAWMPNQVGPFAGDPLYPDPMERTFDLWQDYAIQRDGGWQPAAYVRGELVINTFLGYAQPRIVGAVLASGGTLAGGQTVYAAVTVRDAGDHPAPPSNVTALWIDPALTNQKMTLTINPPLSGPPAGGSWAGWDLWVGTNRRRIAWQQAGSGPLPLTLDILGPIHPMTRELPEASARQVSIAAKQVWHSGVAGMSVSSVTAPNKIQCNELIHSTDPWATGALNGKGRYVSVLADYSDGSVPLWDFQITAFDSATGTLTVSPDCVRTLPNGDPDPGNSVQESDPIIIRTWADSVSPDGATITDPLWNNSVNRAQFNSPGMQPGQEPGRVYRILRGTGAGQYSFIVANDATSVTVKPPFAILPDKTSIGIVEAADWVYSSQSSDLDVAAPGAVAEIRMRVDNLRDRVVLVGGFLLDDQDRQTDENWAVYREIYIFGQPPTVRVIGPTPSDPDGNPADTPPNRWNAYETDHTIRVDTSAQDVSLWLPPLYVYQGRTLTIWNDGANKVIINAADGEMLWDGSTSVTIDTQGTSVKVTSA